MPKTYKHSLGFTLLELMLVIFIIGILSVLGLSFYQRQTLATKITQTSLQMQQILQAASAFYIDNSCWPNATANCPQCSPTVPSFDQYLPAGISKNPFGSENAFKYSYHPEPTLCRKFQVLSGTLPSNSIIDRVLALLPSAGRPTTTIYPNQVLAEISTPSSQAQELPNYIVQYIGISRVLNDSDYSSYSFSCPTGWIPTGFALPYSLSASDWKIPPLSCRLLFIHLEAGSLSISKLSLSVSCTGQNPVQCSYQLSLQSRYRLDQTGCPWDRTGTGQMQFVEIGLCNNPQASQSKPPFAL